MEPRPQPGPRTIVEVSVVIPVYNEEALLEPALREFEQSLEGLKIPFEILVMENGSVDDTPIILSRFSENPRIRAMHLDDPNYGAALRLGIREARGNIVICEELDICNGKFHRDAIEILKADNADVVIGSKTLPESDDRRPFLRRIATRIYNLLLRLLVGFRGTDSHGLKAFHRSRILPIVDLCITDRDVFASELIVRSQRGGWTIMETPITLSETRTPPIPLARRVPRVLLQLARLTWAIRGPQRETS